MGDDRVFIEVWLSTPVDHFQLLCWCVWFITTFIVFIGMLGGGMFGMFTHFYPPKPVVLPGFCGCTVISGCLSNH